MGTFSKGLLGVIVSFVFVSSAWAGDALLETMGPGDGNGGCDIRLEKIGPRRIKVGDFFSYYIRLENRSGCSLDGLRLKDYLPERVKFERKDPNSSGIASEVEAAGEMGGAVKWTSIELDPWEVKYFELRVHVLGPPNRNLVNEVCLSQYGRENILCDKKVTRVVTGNDFLNETESLL